MAVHSKASIIKKNRAIPISVARTKLFELAEDVLTYRADRVALSHKDHDEQLVLVRSSDLAKMEADIAALRERAGIVPHSLRGIMRLNVDADEVLTEVRRRQAELWEAKLASLTAPYVEGDESDE